MHVFDQLKILYQSQLFGDVEVLGNMLLTLSENKADFLTLPMKYQTMVYVSEALYNSSEYTKAESIYRKALQLKKMINKAKGKTQVPSEMMSEIEVKFKLYLCYQHMKNYREAIAVLEGISAKQRNSRINMALAKLYQMFGMDRSAITSYKEVLRECPMSLEAVQGLLAHGVKGAEVTLLMAHGAPSVASGDWVSTWVKAQAYASTREYNSALQVYHSLDTKPLLRNNIELLCNMGEVHFLNGDYTQALTTFQRVRSLEPMILNKMELLAYLLYREKRIKEIESLATQLMQASEAAAESWVAMGYFCLATKKPTRAVYFAQKAFTLDNRLLEALLLKGAGLVALKKVPDAVMHFREALRLASYRYEAHKGLVECYLASHRSREAVTCAQQAYKRLGPNARSYTLYASVLAKDPMSREKAKTLLEKAMKLDSTYLDAVYLMAEILDQQHHFDKGIELLRKALRQKSTCRLHQMLADLLYYKNEIQEAFEQYSNALSLDPSNVKAREGLERAEKHGELGMDSTYDVEVEDMEASENEADQDGSEIESAWSDIDLS